MPVIPRHKRLLRVLVPVLLLLISSNAYSQAPNITYTTPQIYLVNKAITPLAPKNTGGAVPASIYGQVSTIASGFATATGVTADKSGIVYAADWATDLIKKIAANGTVTVLAGNGNFGAANGQGAAATFYNPDALAIDNGGNIYVADQSNNLIRKITPQGLVSTFAGSGISGFNDGTGTVASFNSPRGLAFDAAGNLYVADQANNAIRKITPAGTVSTYAANAFNTPTGVCVDALNNIYVADAGSNTIKKITPNGMVSTFVTGLNFPRELRIDETGNIYVADQNNNSIKRISPTGVIATIVSNGLVNAPLGLWLDGLGNLYVGDNGSGQIKKIVVSGYTIDKALPTGLVFDPKTGIISGTPTTLLSTPTNYIITAFNGTGSSSTIVTLQILDKIPSVITLPLQQPGNLDASNTYDPHGTSTNPETPITYTSSDPTIATVTPDGRIHVLAPGVTTITAHQAGNANYNDAVPVSQQLTVTEYLYVEVPLIAAKTTCDADFNANVYAPETKFPVVYTSSNPAVATISDQGVIHITGVGATTITATQNGQLPLFVSDSDSKTLTVTLPVSPSVSIAAVYASNCVGSAITFTATPGGNAGAKPAYQWQVNGISAGTNATTFTSSTLVDGDKVTCIITNTNSACLANFQTTSNVVGVSLVTPSKPSVSISPSVNYVYAGVPITFTASVKDAIGNVDYQWQVNGISAGTNSATLTGSTFANGDVVTCTITPQAACSTPATSEPVTVVIVTQLTIPNTFTPNGDGINDVWNISGIANYPDCLVNIYNRYGALVYQSTGYSHAWNGTSNGGMVPAGTYYYLITDKLLPDKKLSGSLTVIR